MMPLFYFDSRDGKIVRDENGLVFADVEAARREAVRSAGELTMEVLRDGHAAPQEITVEVLDEHRKLLFKAVVEFRIDDGS